MSHKFQELLDSNIYRCLNVIIVIIVIILFNAFVSYALHVIFSWNV